MKTAAAMVAVFFSFVSRPPPWLAELCEVGTFCYDGSEEVAMIEFTDEHRRRLQSGKAIDVVDPHTNQSYVVLGKDVYDRLQHLLCDDSEWTDDELRLQLARSAHADGWDEPAMDAYDHYDEEL